MDHHPFNMMLEMFPLIVLYFAGVLLAWMVQRGNSREPADSISIALCLAGLLANARPDRGQVRRRAV